MSTRRETRARIGAIAVALVHLLVSTQGLFGVLDAVAPLEKTAAATWKCSHHACGCVDAAACRDHCCCSGMAEPPSSPNETTVPRTDGVAVSYFDLARCSGHDGSSSLAPGVALDVPGPSAEALPLQLLERRPLGRPAPLAFTLREVPGKIPI